MRNVVWPALLLLAAPLAALPGDDPDAAALAHVEAAIERSLAGVVPESPTHLQPCVNGTAAGVYPCQGIDLLEFMPLATFGATFANSGWGWTDSLTGKDYYLLGLNNGTAFIDITDPENPLYLGKLPTHTGTSNTWRDVRVYQNYAYVVSEQSGHGMQVFDLTQLRNVVNPPVTFSETAHYNKTSNTHTISINEETGFAYLVGTTGGSGPVVTCGGNVHIVSLATPASPQFVACYDDDSIEPGYVHENQCFVYHGPDTSCDDDANPNTPPVSCQGKEICLAARGSAHDLDILNVTDHAAPKRISSLHFNNSGYSHQAWFTEDHRYILLNDELDEENQGTNTRTWIFDALDLDNPVLAGPNGYHQHPSTAIDHNLYVVGNYVTESNYASGLRILELTDLADAALTEVAFFDVFPADNAAEFNGTWNHYPFFASGVIPVTHMQQGLYLLKPTEICLVAPAAPTALSAVPNGDNSVHLEWTGSGSPGAEFRVERAAGGCGGVFETVANELTATTFDDVASGSVLYGYRVRELTNEGACASLSSECVETTPTGECTEAPAFGGIATAASSGSASCAVELAWSAAAPYCGADATYSIYRGASDDFVPGAGNRIAEGVTGLAFTDVGAPSGVPSYYVVHATDTAIGAEDGNEVRRSAIASGPPADGPFSTGAEVGDPILDTFAPAENESPDAPDHAGWHLSTARAHSGSRSFFSTSSSSLCVSLETDDLELSNIPGQPPSVSFWTAWDIEATFDGGIVQISTDSGANWTTLGLTGGFYPNNVTQSGNACSALAAPPSKPAFSSINQLSWQSKTIDLSAWAGQTVKLGWRYGSDGGLDEEGWYVDDVAIQHVQLPGSCSSNAIFIERHEGGSFGAWSSVVTP